MYEPCFFFSPRKMWFELEIQQAASPPVCTPVKADPKRLQPAQVEIQNFSLPCISKRYRCWRHSRKYDMATASSLATVQSKNNCKSPTFNYTAASTSYISSEKKPTQVPVVRGTTYRWGNTFQHNTRTRAAAIHHFSELLEESFQSYHPFRSLYFFVFFSFFISRSVHVCLPKPWASLLVRDL